MLMVLAGLLLAFISLANKQERLNCTPLIKKRVRRSFCVGLVAAIACANIVNWFLFPGLIQYPLAQRISLGGFSFYYGMLGFFGVSALLLLAHRLDFKFWINQIIPSVLLFHFFGRIGCSLSGCCYGVGINLFGLTFDFPARELEALALFVLYFVFEKKIKERRLFWYLLCYSVLRFGLEFGRADDRGQLIISWLSPAQVTSVIIWVVLGVSLLVEGLLKKTRKTKNTKNAQ
ncbi:MAG: prolipoprotein diacylglyceryl transferase [Peptococcaceae bacterium]|nr:prolipoprotein diacylglyceryl transferase [Peptococcaceae bacterium]